MRRSAGTAPLREREFRLLFVGRTVSLVGNAIAPVALAFAVLDLTGSKTDLGLILAAREIPLVVFLLAGGIWADRLPRNRVMVGANVVSGLSQADRRRAPRSRAAPRSGTSPCSRPSTAARARSSSRPSRASIPQTVPSPLLQQANALLALAMNTAVIGGAALGGILVAAVGPGWAIAIDGATYLVGAVFIALMRLPALAPDEAKNFVRELATAGASSAPARGSG